MCFESLSYELKTNFKSEHVTYFQNSIVGNLKPRNKLKYDHAQHVWLILSPNGAIETNAYPYFSIIVFQIYSSDLILEFTVRQRFWNIF